MSECFCRHICHQPDNELLGGQLCSLCRSQFEVHYTDRSPRKKKVSLIFRYNFLHFSLCPLPYVLATSKKHLLPSFSFPPHSVKFYKLTRFPRAFLSSGCTTLMAQVTASVQGLNWQHTGKPLWRLSPSLPGQCRAGHPRGFVNFLNCSASNSTH